MNTTKGLLLVVAMLVTLGACEPAEVIEPAKVGALCSQDSDCVTGYCVEFTNAPVQDGKRCRQYCDRDPANECPDNAICGPASGGATELPVCVPLH